MLDSTTITDEQKPSPSSDYSELASAYNGYGQSESRLGEAAEIYGETYGDARMAETYGYVNRG
jgi:hypothetical protein